MIRKIELYKKELVALRISIKKLKKEKKLYRKILPCEAVIKEHEIEMLEITIEYYRSQIRAITKQVPV